MKYYSLTGRRNHSRPLKRLLDTWDRKGSTSGPTPWNIHYDDNNNKDNNRARIHSNIESKTGHISVHTHTHTHTHTHNKPKPYDLHTGCRAPWTEIGPLKCFYLHSCTEGFPARAINVWAIQDSTHCDRFPKTHYFWNKVTWLLFYLSKARLKLLAPVLMWKCTPVWRNFIEVHAQKYFFYKRSVNGVYNSPAWRESTTPVTSKPPVSMATGFPPTDGNSPIYGINSYFVSMVTGFAWLR